MRMMLKFTVPVEQGNAAIKDGSLGQTVDAVMAMLKPEASYFGPIDGMRCGMMFFEMTDAGQLVEYAEPLFLKLNAKVDIVPVMNADDLKRGFAAVAKG
jgi:hypothetical protein